MSFHDLHHQGVPFVLPNAWDVPSALAYLADGFTAIGTTSFGLSSSGGHPDGGRATRDANIALAAALAPLQCYVSVDIEDGYSDDPDVVADYVAQLPIAGINIEDSTDGKLIDPALAAAKVAAIKQRNPTLFINARVDTYWLDQEANTAATLERGLRYVDAGADGIFVPLANDRTELAEIARNIPRPVNSVSSEWPGYRLGQCRTARGCMPRPKRLAPYAMDSRCRRRHRMANCRAASWNTWDTREESSWPVISHFWPGHRLQVKEVER
jgi:2-methylisocitrate lyase-like PEP mutase family enzyme